MAEDLIRYDLLVQDALRGVVRKVLGQAARDGLQGEHLPDGYVVLGTGERTPYYLCLRDSKHR